MLALTPTLAARAPQETDAARLEVRALQRFESVDLTR